MATQTTLEEIEDVMECFPFQWNYGLICEITKGRKQKFASNHCSLCGSDENVGYEKISGGHLNLICKDCAIEYVKNAKRLVKDKNLIKP